MDAKRVEKVNEDYINTLLILSNKGVEDILAYGVKLDNDK